MRANLPILAVVLGVALLAPASAQAQAEGQPCIAEPTDQLVAFGDHVSPCTIGQDGDSDLFRFQGVMGEIVSIWVTDQSGGGSIPGCRASGSFLVRVFESSNTAAMTYALQIG